MGRRHYRRIRTMLSVEYETTPEQIDAFCEGIRELIRRHPYTRKDYYQVYLNQFGDSSLIPNEGPDRQRSIHCRRHRRAAFGR